MKIPWYKVKGTTVATVRARINPSVPTVMTLRFLVPQSNVRNFPIPFRVKRVANNVRNE